MRYSDYETDRFISPMYEQVAKKLLTVAKDEDTRRKMEGILYEGGFDDFSVNASFNMEEKISYKNNPTIESKKRLDMAYLLLTNPKMIEVIQKNKGCFFHGTNAAALPSILKYGINSVDKSTEDNIAVKTGEEWSRINGKRNFVSLTDCFNVGIHYASMSPNDNNLTNSLLNFGVVIGTSFEDIDGINFLNVSSDVSEIGIKDNVPVNYIKFLAVSEDKVEFVKKMVGEKDIDVVSIDIEDKFFDSNFVDKLSLLEQGKENIQSQKEFYRVYCKNDVEPIVKERKISSIRKIFEDLKAKMFARTKKTEDKDISERG